MGADEYISVKDKSKPSEEIRRDLQPESDVTQNETDHPPERVSESTELAKDTREPREIPEDYDADRCVREAIAEVRQEEAERHRKRKSEVGDISKKEAADEIDRLEEVNNPKEVRSEVKESKESSPEVEIRLQDALKELRVQENKEDNISQKMEEALGELREMESKKETTESKINEAIEDLGEPINDSEPQLRTEIGSKSDVLDDYECNIESMKEFNQAQERYSDIETRRDYEDQLDEIKKYFEDDKEGKDTQKPDFVEEIERRETRRLYETVHNGPPEVRIESMQDVDKLLEEHPEEKERRRFDEQYRHCKVYFEVKNQHEIRREDLAKEHDVCHTYIGNWRNGIESTLIRNLRGKEEERIIKEWSESKPQISEEHLREFQKLEQNTPKEVDENRTGVHQVNEQVVREAASQLKERKSISKEDIVKTAEQMHQQELSDNVRVRYADFQTELTPEKISEMEKVLHNNRREIEKSVSKNLGLEDSRVRIAVVNEKLYTWVPKIRKDELVSAYEDQFYYFKDRREIGRVTEELQTRLGIEGNRRESLKQLNELIQQLTLGDNSERSKITKTKPIGGKTPRLEGKVIRMYLDSSDKRLSELEGRVKKITGINGQAGIDNPRFPEGKKLEVLKARLISIIASDCHLRPSGSITYNEEYPERILRVQEIIREFGDIPLEPNFRRGVYDVHIRNQIGLMVIKEGMTPGDKTIQNPGLPESYKHWSEEARGAYLEELICEDGNFKKSTGFSWYRNHALHDANEDGRYDFKSVVTPAEIELIKDEGNQSKGLVPQYELSMGELDRQCNSSNPERSQVAQSLRDAISNSPNNLIEDEKKIAESLGIQINLSPISVKYYPRSGRVSVKRTATTASKEDALLWGTMCPPNDARKRKQVEEWLTLINNSEEN